MTERERIHEVEIQHPKTVDELMATTRPLREVALPEAPPQAVTRTLVVMPVDRVRWAAVLTGLVVTLVTMALLRVLGLAIGFTTITPGDIAGTLGSGTGVWSAISILLALVVGGWAAARTAAVPGRANGALNGAMVWVATTLLVFALRGSGLATLAAVAGDIVTTGTQLAALLTGRAAANAPELFYAGSIAAWGTLLLLLLGFVAATLGGLLGARSITDLMTTYVLPHERTALR